MAHHVYLLASRKHGTSYVKATQDLVRRVHEKQDQGGLRGSHRVTALTPCVIRELRRSARGDRAREYAEEMATEL